MGTNRWVAVWVLLLAGMLVSLPCMAVQQQTMPSGRRAGDMAIVQDGVTISVNQTQKTVVLQRRPFAIRYFGQQYDTDRKRDHAAIIVATRKRGFLQDIRVGMPRSDVPGFSPGLGLAMHDDGSDHELFVTDDGYNYLFYQGPHKRRLKLLGRDGKYLQLEYRVESFVLDHKNVPVQDTRFDKLYLVIYVDRNLNGVIDPGELKELTLVF